MNPQTDEGKLLAVVDTNVFLSALAVPQGGAARHLCDILKQAEVLCSKDTLAELSAKLSSEWLLQKRGALACRAFYALCKREMTEVTVLSSVFLSRDPADNKFLDLAVTARADMVISGDSDLLIVKTLKGIGHNIPVIRPADFAAYVPHDVPAAAPRPSGMPAFLQGLAGAKPRT